MQQQFAFFRQINFLLSPIIYSILWADMLSLFIVNVSFLQALLLSVFKITIPLFLFNLISLSTPAILFLRASFFALSKINMSFLQAELNQGFTDLTVFSFLPTSTFAHTFGKYGKIRISSTFLSCSPFQTNQNYVCTFSVVISGDLLLYDRSSHQRYFIRLVQK